METCGNEKKLNQFTFHYGWIKNHPHSFQQNGIHSDLHSTMVGLKTSVDLAEAEVLANLHSTMVGLKTAYGRGCRAGHNHLHSTMVGLKTEAEAEAEPEPKYIYIPLWLD